jgi:integrase
MSARITKRGKYWQIRGTVRVGKASRRLRETTGTDDEKTATLKLNARVAEVERELLLGDAAPKRKRAIPNFATAAGSYLAVKTHLGHQDRNKLLAMGVFFENTPIDELDQSDWDLFVTDKLPDRKASTIHRWHAMFMAPLLHASNQHKFNPPKIELPQEGAPRKIRLKIDVRDALLAAYSEHAFPIAMMLCYQGCRVSEALRLTWRDISVEHGTIEFRITKNDDPRTVPMHPEVREVLLKLYEKRQAGLVFLTPDGKPYNDRRAASHGDGSDGSGIRTAHASALRRCTIGLLMKNSDRCRHCRTTLKAEPGRTTSAVVQLITAYSKGGVDDLENYALSCRNCDLKDPPAEPARVHWFHIHDWRHHWASWFIMDGGRESALMELGGWKSPSMVQRYVSLYVEHLREELNNAQRRRG